MRSSSDGGGIRYTQERHVYRPLVKNIPKSVKLFRDTSEQVRKFHLSLAPRIDLYESRDMDSYRHSPGGDRAHVYITTPFRDVWRNAAWLHYPRRAPRVTFHRAVFLSSSQSERHAEIIRGDRVSFFFLRIYIHIRTALHIIIYNNPRRRLFPSPLVFSATILIFDDALSRAACGGPLDVSRTIVRAFTTTRPYGIISWEGIVRRQKQRRRALSLSL